MTKLEPRKPRINFGPGQEYDWVKKVNSDDFVAHPEYRIDGPQDGKVLPAPMEIIEAIMEETISYPEIMEAFYTPVPPEEHETWTPNFGLGHAYNAYIKWTYGNHTDAHLYAGIFLSGLYLQNWSGKTDPRYIASVNRYVAEGKIVLGGCDG